MRFGDIKNFILFGGGQLLLDSIGILQSNGFRVVVFSSKRRLAEEINDDSFRNHLNKNGVDYFESRDINNDNNLNKVVNEQTIGISMGAPWIFKKSLVNTFKGILLNMHCRRLPKYRGGGGIFMANNE